MRLKKTALAALGVTALAAGLVPTTVEAQDQSLISLILGNSTVGNMDCANLNTILTTTGVLTSGMTASQLQTAMGNKVTALGTMVVADKQAVGVLATKLAADTTTRARECGLVKPDPLESFLNSVGSSENSQQIASALPFVKSLANSLTGQETQTTTTTTTTGTTAAK